ncbi:MAG: hypothetical protein H6721_13755 [Sandaracinus sp.]|nr:hypothetical protein [Sandaracinus sp.]MCB9633181.1 hypothetical protein [Sandaracinus sp.]
MPDPRALWLAELDEPTRSLALATEETVLRWVPGATSRVRPGWGVLGFDAPRYFAYLHPRSMGDTFELRLGFEHGVGLSDPDGLLEGGGKQVRWLRVSRAKLRSTALRALVCEAAELAR